MLRCTICKTQFVVSYEDPDATLQDAFEHLHIRHPYADPAKAIVEVTTAAQERRRR